MQFFLELVFQGWKKKQFQVAEDMLHFAITSCNLLSVQNKIYEIVAESRTEFYFVQLLQT